MRNSVLVLPLALGLSLSLAAAAGHAQNLPSARLGRLFSSPGERSLLDSKRGSPLALAQPGNLGQPGDVSLVGGPAADAVGPTAGPPAVTYNGLVRANHGHTTVWLDATPASDSTPNRDGKSVTLRLSSGRKLLMQPGQRYDALSGKVLEGASATPPKTPALTPDSALLPPDLRP